MSPVDGEQPDQQNSHHWSQDRLHADVHRAVGGCLNLLRELGRISFQINDSVPTEWVLKRAQFFAYELQSQVDSEASERDRLAALNRFFFEAKNFQSIPDASRLPAPLAAYTLSQVLMGRAGAPTVLALLYAYLAERIGLSLEFVDLKPTCFLKWTDGGRSRFIDINRCGATLSSDELIEMLHSRFQMMSFGNANLLETYSFESYLVDYLTELKTRGAATLEPAKLLFIQNTLISYQPSNLFLLAERAILHRRLGHFKSALADLKRYFAFHDREKAPAELVKLFDDLTVLLDRHKASIDIVE